MWWVQNIFSFVWDISEFFFDAYKRVKDWVWPFYYLQYPLYGLGRVFWDLLTPIAHFNEWVDDVANKVKNILTSEGILGLINWWFPKLGKTIEWFLARWSWFSSLIILWWAETSKRVLGWISIAVQGLDTLLVDWDNFWTVTFPNLISFKWLGIWWNSRLVELGKLIDDTIKAWLPFYDDLVELWNGIVEFFCDPLEWIQTRFIDWFLGKEK